MLFSEPKIPQFRIVSEKSKLGVSSFSALQRAENSSIHTAVACNLRRSLFVSVLFSEPKIPQLSASIAATAATTDVSVLFSEPKIPQSSVRARRPRSPVWFQCSSASRKFLNLCQHHRRALKHVVSVLFSEPKIPQLCCWSRFLLRNYVSVLFSEPKIPQSLRLDVDVDFTFKVSVLFSEPKIPQLARRVDVWRFPSAFQCSSASRKFLNTSVTSQHPRPARVSVLFSEPKIPQFTAAAQFVQAAIGFSALQRAENSSIVPRFCTPDRGARFQCSSASRKFLNLMTNR